MQIRIINMKTNLLLQIYRVGINFMVKKITIKS